MAEDYVTYELAVKLKEKGYPQRCGGKYDMIGACYFNDGRLYEDGCIAPVEDCFTAPTISQVLKWLREEKYKFVCIEFFNYEIGFGYKLVRLDYVDNITENQGYKTYEQAALAGIEYVLDNLM